MRLLRLIRSLNPVDGGPIEGVLQITPHLDTLGISTTVCSLDPPSSCWLHDQPFLSIGLGPVHGRYGYRRSLPQLIRSHALKHDAVIIHGIWQYHAFATWRALHGINIPYFVYPHGMLDPWFKRTYPRKHLKKWAYWLFSDYRVLRDADAVLFTTEQERHLARQSFWLYRANDIVAGYGTSSPPSDTEHQRQVFLHQFPHLKGKRILLFLSRIHPKKGVDLLLESFAAIASSDPRLELVIAGPDQVGWLPALQQKAVALGVAHRITWPGMLSGDLKWGAFRCAELFCLPSHQENFAIVIAEALACALPVALATPVNLSETIAVAHAGLVHSDTLAGTSDALHTWLTLSQEEKTQMGVRGELLFKDKFDISSVALNLQSILMSSIHARHPRLLP